MSETSTIYDAKAGLSRLVARAEAGERITITRHGKPVARLVPFVPDPPARAPGVARGRIVVAEDFDDLDADALRDWYGA